MLNGLSRRKKQVKSSFYYSIYYKSSFPGLFWLGHTYYFREREGAGSLLLLTVAYLGSEIDGCLSRLTPPLPGPGPLAPVPGPRTSTTCHIQPPIKCPVLHAALNI